METNKKGNQKQPMRYWLVEITLTSGEGLQFYVKAINQFEANKTADSYAILAEDDSLRNKMKQFVLRH